MSKLAEQHCVPCRGGVPPLDESHIAPLHAEVPTWDVVKGRRLTRAFAFRDFKTALGFVDRIGALAEEQGHHPDVHLTYGQVRVDLWTHKVDGLTESDFVLAAKIDRLAGSAPGRM